MTRTPPVFLATGVVAAWTGNEANLTIGNPVLRLRGSLVATRGEQWQYPDDVTTEDVRASSSYRPFPKPVRINSGDVVWLAGPEFTTAYRRFFRPVKRIKDLRITTFDRAKSGRTIRPQSGPPVDMLGLWPRPAGQRIPLLPEWTALADAGWFFHIGRPDELDRHGRTIAAQARSEFLRPPLIRLKDNAKLRETARLIYAGTPGVALYERRVTDAMWATLNGDKELRRRSIRLAAILDSRDEHDVQNAVDKRLSKITKRTAVEFE